jgi:membrane peptidoglycan carboxypeptidase
MHPSVRTRRRLRRLTARRTRAGHLLGLGALLAMLAAGAGTVALAFLFSAYAGVARGLPADPSAAFARQNLGPAKIYDRHGTLLYEFEDETEGLRNPVRLDDISPYVIQATIATEDASFYSNPGVNLRGLVRAGIENLTETDVGLLRGTGGSSITQQLVKNAFIEERLRYERSIARKLKETVYAVELTRRYSKDQILEWYLNQIHYGNRANGIGAAARRYFNTSAKELTLAQAAFLAGFPQSPARYDPYHNREAANARQHQVLDLMVRNGYITEEQAAAAKAEGEQLQFAAPSVTLLAPHWVFYVRDQLIGRFGLETFRNGGLRVITTLDLPLQQKAEQIVEEKIAHYESPQGGNCQCHNGALVAIDNNTGQILAMVGSRNYWRPDIEGENNNAIAIKQPGSAFKPVVYLAAFEKGWNPGTIIYDAPTSFLSRIDGVRREYFTPVGPTRSYLGPLSAREALASSMNTPAVKAAAFVGPDAVIDMAHRLGITTLDDRENYGVSIATGGANLTLLDLTYVYATIAANGEMRGVPALKPAAGHRKVDPVALLKVTDGNDRVLWEFTEPVREQVVPAGLAYAITDILKDNDAKRHTYTAPDYQFGFPDRRPVAAKTGTQQGPKDIRTVLATWNFGYVPDLTVGVWVGNANNALVNANLTSASSSLLIWKEFMAAAFTMLTIPPKEFPVPPDVDWQMVNGRREPVLKGARIVRLETQLPWAVRPASGMIVVRDGQVVDPFGTGATPQAGATPTPDADGAGRRATAAPTAPPSPAPPAPAAAAPTAPPAATPDPRAQPTPFPPRRPPAPAPPAGPPGPPAPECRPQPPLYAPCPRR